jgi:hypothetical protein
MKRGDDSAISQFFGSSSKRALQEGFGKGTCDIVANSNVRAIGIE